MSRIGATVASALLAATMSCVAPAHAQPQKEKSPLEQLLDGVKGVFDRVLGQPPAQPQAPPPEPAAAPVEERSPAPPQPVAATPAARPAREGLHEAIARGDYATGLKLIEEGADINEKDPGAGASPLHYAVMKGKLPMIELLISRGADVASRTRNGTTALHTAVLYSRLEAADLLIAAGADVNAQSASGATPLKLAETAKNDRMAALLRERGGR
jgi:hypothetical protein